MAETGTQPSMADPAVTWLLENKLRAVFYTWATGVGGSLAFQWSRPIPTSLKIIHSRVYAQAITLAALGAVAGVEMYAASDANIKPASRHGDY